MRGTLLDVGVLLLTAAAAVPAQDVTVGTAVARRGKTAYGELQVAPGIDSGYRIQVAVINGSKPGKTIAFVAGSHGTEYASIVAMSRLISKIDAEKLTGTVIVVPLVNVASMEQMVVHINPVDRKGMNSGFPGQHDGTQSERAVAVLAEQVVGPADYIVDLHGGDLDEDLRPYTYWTRIGDTAKDQVMRSMAMAFGIDHIIVRDAEVGSAGRTLGGYAIDKGKLSIVAEAGRSGLVLDDDINALVNGSLNVLGTLGMINRKVKPVAKPIYITAGMRVGADQAGMWFPTVARDKTVSLGQVVGYTTDFLGRKTGDVKSPVAGLVTFIRTVPSMPMRATLVNVSTVLPAAPAWVKPRQ